MLPWEALRVRLFLSHRRKSLFYWRFIAPHPHALRLVSKRQWSGTLRHALATASARHKSRQTLGDRRSIRWQWRFDTPPKPPSTVPTGASFLVARSVGQSVFIPSPTKVPAPTRCEQRTLPTSANTARAHSLLNSRAALAAPKGASSLRNS